ncbi:efflux RND transporter periplasmic adaptor subunit [Hydrogenophaga sp. T2]|uniref:efflux RND transporter periplasmic adaptor subunit n=1 Tax=Hydrogenophaga sp. T2 TaxID=3132823 RepID=UPI003CED18A7
MTLSRTRKILYWTVPVLLVAGLALGVLRALDKRATKAEQARSAAQALQTAPVYEIGAADVVRVRTLALQQTASVSGSIKALQTVAIKARVAGEVQGLNKREGDSVAAGEVVARIDPTESQARVRQAEQQAESALAQVRIAQRTQSNNQALVQQGFISGTALETSQANLAAAEANHRAAMAALDIARKGLGDTVLRSPIAGQIAARAVQNGERVGLDARVVDVVDLSAFEMEAALSPADAAAVRVGQKARLQVEGLSQPVDAGVVRINPSVQPGSRSVLVYLRLPAVAGMRQGLFARGEIVAGSQQALAVPASAVRNDRPAPYVQVVREGVVRHVPLPEGGAPRGLLDGVPQQAVPMLTEGEVVLGATAGAIRDGTRVKLAAAAN